MVFVAGHAGRVTHAPATVLAKDSVPGKVVAQLMGHTNADVTINVYTQVLDASLRTAVDRIGGELFTIVHETKTGSELNR